MNVTVDGLIEVLLMRPGRVAVVGTGMLAAQMRQLLHERLRLPCEGATWTTSAEAPLDREVYILCASPETQARATLLARGVAEAAMVSWPAVRPEVESRAEDFLRDRLGLRTEDVPRPELPDDEVTLFLEACEAHARTVLGRALRPVGVAIPWPELLAQLLSALRRVSRTRRPDLLYAGPTSSAWTQLWRTCLEDLYAAADDWSADELALVDVYSQAYLAQRAAPESSGTTGRERRLLFPSPGRCGGSSLTLALSRHPSLMLRVDHEGRAALIYRLLRHHRRQQIGPWCLGALLDVMLSDFDCAGGNPFCFLVPYVDHVPWFACHMLKVERPPAELRESIELRNFHYSPADFVPNRITAADWGDMDRSAWDALPLSARIDWYGAKVFAEIERGAPSCARVVRAPLSRLGDAVNDVLSGMGWPRLTAVPHVMTLPRDRVYTYEERIAIYARDAEARDGGRRE